MPERERTIDLNFLHSVRFLARLGLIESEKLSSTEVQKRLNTEEFNNNVRSALLGENRFGVKIDQQNNLNLSFSSAQLEKLFEPQAGGIQEFQAQLLNILREQVGQYQPFKNYAQTIEYAFQQGDYEEAGLSLRDYVESLDEAITQFEVLLPVAEILGKMNKSVSPNKDPLQIKQTYRNLIDNISTIVADLPAAKNFLEGLNDEQQQQMDVAEVIAYILPRIDEASQMAA